MKKNKEHAVLHLLLTMTLLQNFHISGKPSDTDRPFTVEVEYTLVFPTKRFALLLSFMEPVLLV